MKMLTKKEKHLYVKKRFTKSECADAMNLKLCFTLINLFGRQVSSLIAI